MSVKSDVKNQVISLRKQGYSYSDILKKVKVSKSSLSLWLKDITLSKRKINNLIKKVTEGQILGAKASRDKRINISNKIRKDAIREIGYITKKEMLMLGAMLYWGEGSKQTGRNTSQPVEFVNSDPKMCKFFVKWITEIVGVNTKDLIFRVYINESKKKNSNEYRKVWSGVVNISSQNISVYFTKDRHSNLKRSGRDSYKGQLRIVVKKSTNLNRRIAGLIEGVCIQSGVND